MHWDAAHDEMSVGKSCCPGLPATKKPPRNAKRQIGVERKTERVFQPSTFIADADGMRSRLQPWLRKGRDSDDGSEWLQAQAVLSRGPGHKVLGLNIPRIHLVLSELEAACLSLLEFQHDGVNISDFACSAWDSGTAGNPGSQPRLGADVLLEDLVVLKIGRRPVPREIQL